MPADASDRRITNLPPRHIAIFLPNLAGGGAERVMLHLAEQLAARGHRVDLLVASGHGELVAQVPARVRLIDFKAERLRSALRPLTRYLKRDKPDTLLAVMWPLTVIAVAAHRLARSRARLVVSDHAVLSQGYTSPKARRAIGLTARLAYPRADARIICSGEAADDLAILSRVKRGSIEVLHNPVAMPEVLPDRGVMDAVWGPGEGERLLALGSLKAEKNHALLIEAFARLREERPKARLAIVGEGRLRNRLEAQRDALGLHDAVILPGFAIDPWPWLASCDLFVLTSDSEALPVVLVEALHAGKTIVSTGAEGGPGEILGQGEHGDMVPRGNVPALVRAMDVALAHPADPEFQRRRARMVGGAAKLDRWEQLLAGPPSIRA